MKHLIIASILILAVARPAEAQLKLEILDGRVNLDAKSVPARQILAEWARIGGTRVVGGEKVTGIPMTLKLVDMPERQALDIILRNVAGYMAAPRQASAPPGASTYDRIMILATSVAPAPAPGTARTTGAGAGATTTAPMGPTAMGRRVPPRPPNLPPSPAEAEAEQAEPEQEDQADTGVQAPVFTFPSQPGNANQVFVPMSPNGPTARPGTVAAPVISLQPNANGQPTVYTFVPNPDSAQAPAAPATPFGAVGAPSPGMIQLQPAPGQPQRPPK